MFGNSLSRSGVGCLLALLALCPARGAQTLPAASNVLERIVARAKTVAQSGQSNHYTYEKRSLVEELDEKERVTKSTEKLYQVMLVNGLPFQRLVRIQGRELNAKELEKENQRETAFREKATRVNLKKKARNREGLVTQDLVDRFSFNVTRRELVDGRSTLVMTFTPKSDAPEDSVEDKVYKHVFGTLWVDEEEAEVRKLDATVRGPISLGWFGAIGSLSKFDGRFERMRMPDGVWVNRNGVFSIAARQLWTAMRMRMTEQSSGFRKE